MKVDLVSHPIMMVVVVAEVVVAETIRQVDGFFLLFLVS